MSRKTLLTSLHGTYNIHRYTRSRVEQYFRRRTQSAMKSVDQKTDGGSQRSIPTPLQRWFEEIQKADVRLRNFPDRNGRSNPHRPREAAIRWALNLANTNLKNLSEGDLDNLGRELRCLCRFDMEPPYIPQNLVEAGPWPKREEIVATQQWLQAIMHQIEARQDLRFTEPETKWFIYYDNQERRWKTFATIDDPHPESIEIFKLIREHLDSLHVCRCDDCEQRLFLKDRRNQEFCSNRCKWRHAQRHRVDRTIPPERYWKRGRPKEAIASGSKKRSYGTKKRTR